MNKWELRNSDIELIYIYVERVVDEFEQDVYTNISLNLSSNIIAAYDYENGLIKIEKRKNVPENFWMVDQNSDTNIMSNTLVLGENGTGKTTLLELIYAGNLEGIEESLGNYLFLYSIRGSDTYYIKSCGLKWIEQIDLGKHNIIKLSEQKKQIKGCKEVYSYFCKIQKPQMPVKKGYYGLITIDNMGKIEIEQYVIELDTFQQRRAYWTKMPMNGIYLSTSIIENEETGRFVSRKSIHHENIVTNLDITQFIFDDMKQTDSIIKSNPYLSFSNITVKNLTTNRQEFLDDSIRTYDYLGMNFPIKSETEHKYRFFATMWISFMIRLSQNQLLQKNIIECFNKETTYKAIYDNIKSQFTNLFIYNSNELFDRYQKVLQAVENLDEKMFECSVRTKHKFRLDWSMPIGIIENNCEWCKQITEFMNTKEDFENNLQREIQKKRITWKYIPNFMLNHNISNMSTGETILISNVFSKITKNMNRIINNDKGPYKKSVLLIMDEPDCTFHIRWTQLLVKYLIEFLNIHYPNFSFQIIMTSHMPFLATDFPRGNIICIPSEEWKQCHCGKEIAWLDGSNLLDNREIYNSLKAFTPSYGFMSNYYDVVKEDFFVDVPIGMFAQNKFDNLKKKVDLITGSTSEQELKNIAMEIELIDEPVLKKYVYDAYQEKLDKLVGRNELEQEAALLEKRLDEINRRLKYMREE